MFYSPIIQSLFDIKKIIFINFDVMTKLKIKYNILAEKNKIIKKIQHLNIHWLINIRPSVLQ